MGDQRFFMYNNKTNNNNVFRIYCSKINFEEALSHIHVVCLCVDHEHTDRRDPC